MDLPMIPDLPSVSADDIDITTVPARSMLAIDGRGAPEDLRFVAAVRALFAARAALGAPLSVRLEGTYAQDGDPLRFDLDQPRGWHWTLAVPAPDGCSAAALARAVAGPVALRVQPVQRVAQVVHPGSYADEGASLASLYGFVAGRGLHPTGAHTEVYLTDPAVTAPARNRTLLRVPVGVPAWTA